MNWCPNCNDLLDSLGQEYVGECSSGSGFEKIYIEPASLEDIFLHYYK